MTQETFDKRTLQRWSEEVFTVAGKKEALEKTFFKLTDLQGEELKGLFYPEELLKINYDPNKAFRIEKILRERTNRNTQRVEYFVKWQGRPEKFNSWIESLEDI